MRRPAAALALLLAVALTACGGGGDGGVDPATATEQDFLGGTCLVLAADALALRRFAVETLAQDPGTAEVGLGDRTGLEAAEGRLRQGVARAGGRLTAPLSDLVAALTALDDGSAGGPGAMTRLRDAAGAVTRACT